ncbi:hypothetical protein M422DRAFT_276837 [Sphaerobolus stellatus SS14]|uniref:C2H2-type domain-containing protein n=1 Tax=Sphaerobolus stellatus (strain SS14) TaxID=990650 RepID=A0A0C9TLE7_SPHS4|nr:hypothetical protein M422DRAFT_276837 [Sphaerobolus stellatus SS14]
MSYVCSSCKTSCGNPAGLTWHMKVCQVAHEDQRSVVTSRQSESCLRRKRMDDIGGSGLLRPRKKQMVRHLHAIGPTAVPSHNITTDRGSPSDHGGGPSHISQLKLRVVTAGYSGGGIWREVEEVIEVNDTGGQNVVHSPGEPDMAPVVVSSLDSRTDVVTDHTSTLPSRRAPSGLPRPIYDVLPSLNVSLLDELEDMDEPGSRDKA